MKMDRNTAESTQKIGQPTLTAILEDFLTKIARILTKHPWYHGLMPRGGIEENLNREGDFIVRKTERRDQKCFILSVLWNKRCHHIPITLLDGQYQGKWVIRGKDCTSSITELIVRHRDRKIPVKGDGTLILNGVPRSEFILLHDSIIKSEKIGAGAYGEVWLATLTQGAQSRKVAVKILNNWKEAETTKEKRAEIVAEAKLMHRLRHENIVKVYGIALQEEPLMIVMEFAPGGSLHSLLRKESVETPQLSKYVIEAARGMCYLAEQKVIHRDIAARNCLLGCEKELKISDFGLSVVGRDAFQLDKLKNVPVKWLAPETLRKGIISKETDVWSFGVLMWEVFSRCQTDPFPGMDNSEAKKIILSGKRPMEAPPGMPEHMSSVMYSCFAQDPAQRPTFEEILAKIDATKQTAHTVKEPQRK